MRYDSKISWFGSLKHYQNAESILVRMLAISSSEPCCAALVVACESTCECCTEPTNMITKVMIKRNVMNNDEKSSSSWISLLMYLCSVGLTTAVVSCYLFACLSIWESVSVSLELSRARFLLFPSSIALDAYCIYCTLAL